MDVETDPYLEAPEPELPLLDQLNLRPGRYRRDDKPRRSSWAYVRVYYDNED